ncbi:hypothetical protein CC79DRAFT_548519 [Sarocladium strictum]
MAETAGLVVGVVSIAALFNNCVECFEYLRLGKSFGRDYQTCQLRLDTAKLRITRWGEAVNIHQNASLAAERGGSDRAAKLAFSYVEQIHHLIQGVQRSAKRYQLVDPSRDVSLATSTDMTVIGSDVHNRATEISERRQRSASNRDKLTWALYEGKEFNQMIVQIMDLVDDLEKVFPVESACQQLVQLEVEEFDDEISLATLQQGAKSTDKVLYNAAAQRRLLISGSNTAGAIQAEADADVQVGNQFTTDLLAQGLYPTDKTRNKSGDISAGGKSKVQIGNRFG